MTDRYSYYIAALEQIIAQQGWNLTRHDRSAWCSFTPHDRREVAFGIMQGTEGNPTLYIKRVHAEAASFPIPSAHYQEAWDQDEYLLEPRGIPLSTFIPLLKLAYERSTEALD